MRTTIVGFATTCLLLISGIAGAQDVYKWVDENGVTSFGETPPENAQSVVRTNVRYSRTDRAAIRAQQEQRQALNNAAETREQQQDEIADDERSIDARNAEIRKQNCQVARDRARKYDEARRLYRATEGGGRDYLTDQELDEERAAANLAVNEWCGKQ